MNEGVRGPELARLVLGGDANEIVDLRTQHGVGADAIDNLDRLFELKVHLGDEPDSIHLEESQIRRALSTPDFFLIVVSNIEGVNARPKVRIIIDPVHQLAMTQFSTVSFTGSAVPNTASSTTSYRSATTKSHPNDEECLNGSALGTRCCRVIGRESHFAPVQVGSVAARAATCAHHKLGDEDQLGW